MITGEFRKDEIDRDERTGKGWLRPGLLMRNHRLWRRTGKKAERMEGNRNQKKNAADLLNI
jgi:hypothetical protein